MRSFRGPYTGFWSFFIIHIKKSLWRRRKSSSSFVYLCPLSACCCSSYAWSGFKKRPLFITEKTSCLPLKLFITESHAITAKSPLITQNKCDICKRLKEKQSAVHVSKLLTEPYLFCTFSELLKCSLCLCPSFHWTLPSRLTGQVWFLFTCLWADGKSPLCMCSLIFTLSHTELSHYDLSAVIQ